MQKEMATHSNILAWEIPQRILVGYSPWVCKRVGRDLATKQQQFKIRSLLNKSTKLEIFFSVSPFFHIQFSSVKKLSYVRLFVTPWTAARQASLSISNSQSLPKLMSTELVMPSNHHLVLCRPLLLLLSVFPSIRVFSNESVLCIRWPKY